MKSCYLKSVKRSSLALTLFFTASGAFAAAYPRPDVRPLACIPADGNARVDVRLDPLPEGLEPQEVDLRLYFRRAADDALRTSAEARRPGHGNFFYVPFYPWEDVFDPAVAMPERGSWSHWAVLPIPQEETLVTESYVAVYDAGGKMLYQSPVAWTATLSDCEVELEDAQRDFADNLVIGETAADQEGRRVIWWECEGLDTRINTAGERRDDRSCFAVILWWANPALYIPAAAVTGVGIVEVLDDSPPDVSPSAP